MSNAALVVSAMDQAAVMCGQVEIPPGFFEAAEYAKRHNICRNTALGQLNRLADHGKLERIRSNNRRVFFGLPRSKDNVSPNGVGKRKRV